MNKLPWFVHRNDAGEDQFHQELIQRFGTQGYGMWWLITEHFDRHAHGEWWDTSPRHLVRQLYTKWPKLVFFLNWLAEKGRLKFSRFSSGSRQVLGRIPEPTGNVLGTYQQDLGMSLPKFREIQAKLKSKTSAKLLKPGEIEIEIEREIEKTPPTPSTAKLSRVSLNTSEPTFSPHFKAFWAAYPNKTGKLKAWQVWKRFKLDKRVSEVVAAVRAQAATPQWLKMNGQYVPHPTTWLSQGRWMDEGQSHRSAQDFEEGSDRTRRWLQQTGGR